MIQLKSLKIPKIRNPRFQDVVYSTSKHSKCFFFKYFLIPISGTSSSWDSLQKSIDITLGSRPDEEIVTKKSIKPTTKVTKILEAITRVMMVLGWTLVNQTVKMKTIAITKSLKNMKTKPLNIHKEEVSNDKTVLNLMNVNNTEINRNFYFPNTFENSTNSQEVKDRVPQENNRKARHSFYPVMVK